MRYFSLLSIFLLSLSFNVFAKTNVDIYQVEIPVSDAIQTQEQALQQGMTQVLVRATGDADITENAVIKSALTKGDNYLTQSGRGKIGDTSTFIMGFNDSQIQALLKKSNATIWPLYRKNILVWIVEDKDLDRKIAWEQSDLPSLPLVQRAASNAGLPITIPIGDIDDMSMMSSSDLWGTFTHSISQASDRYPVDAVLVMKVGYVDGDTQVDWTLYDAVPSQLDNDPHLIQNGSESGELAKSIQTTMDNVVTYYVKKDAIRPASNKASTSTVRLNISGVDNSVSVFRLPKQLRNLASVNSVELNAAQGDVVSFNIGLSSSLDDFKRDIKDSRRFGLDPTALDSTEQVTTNSEADGSTETTTTPVKEAKMEQVWIRLKR